MAIPIAPLAPKPYPLLLSQSHEKRSTVVSTHLPFKGRRSVAALMTVGMVAYLGWDLVWRLIEGRRVMVAEVDRATTFEEIRAAGEKFRKVMGEKGTKALVMLATLATLAVGTRQRGWRRRWRLCWRLGRRRCWPRRR